MIDKPIYQTNTDKLDTYMILTMNTNMTQYLHILEMTVIYTNKNIIQRKEM